MSTREAARQNRTYSRIEQKKHFPRKEKKKLTLQKTNTSMGRVLDEKEKRIERMLSVITFLQVLKRKEKQARIT